jgi:hypothetical protein
MYRWIIASEGLEMFSMRKFVVYSEEKIRRDGLFFLYLEILLKRDV